MVFFSRANSVYLHVYIICLCKRAKNVLVYILFAVNDIYTIMRREIITLAADRPCRIREHRR